MRYIAYIPTLHPESCIPIRVGLERPRLMIDPARLSDVHLKLIFETELISDKLQ